MQGLGQLDDELGVFVAQVGGNTTVIDVNAGISIAHYHVDDKLDMLLARGIVNQHVVDKVAAHGTCIFPVTQGGHNRIRGGLVSLK